MDHLWFGEDVLLVHGTPQRVKDEVRSVRDTLGAPFGGALLLGPAMGKPVGFLTLQTAFLISSIPGALLGMGILHIFQKAPFSRVLRGR